jgi:hypothetical protein
MAQQAPSFNSGIKLRGNLHVNYSAAQDRPKQEHGYGFGLEIVGNSVGLALYGFTHGRAAEFDYESTALNVVLESNYFLPISALRLAPYAGVHTGLGVFTNEYFEDPFLPRPRDSLKGLGYQVGVRFKPIPVIGLDAQWRRASASVSNAQNEALERNQILVGVTLF